MGVFSEVQEFVEKHEPCGGEIDKSVTPVTREGYTLFMTCVCGEKYIRKVTPADARHDLIFSPLFVSPN